MKSTESVLSHNPGIAQHPAFWLLVTCATETGKALSQRVCCSCSGAQERVSSSAWHHFSPPINTAWARLCGLPETVWDRLIPPTSSHGPTVLKKTYLFLMAFFTSDVHHWILGLRHNGHGPPSGHNSERLPLALNSSLGRIPSETGVLVPAERGLKPDTQPHCTCGFFPAVSPATERPRHASSYPACKREALRQCLLHDPTQRV